MQDTLSISEARRVALAAQGFDRPRPGRTPGTAAIRRVIRQLGLIQIDYVNVLLPAHYQVLFSRLGPYSRRAFDDLVYRKREFTEQWAHEASIIPVDMWPLLRHRMDTRRVRPYGFEATLEEHPEYTRWVLEQVRERGPLCAGDLTAPDGMDRRLAQSWFGSVPRAVLEAHFGRGLLAVARRLPNFTRTFDMADRIVSPGLIACRVEREEAERELVRRAARAHGIAAAADLADYFRMPVNAVRRPIAELVEAGELRAVKVEGWKPQAYLYRDALLPKTVEPVSLLSPFDPVIWYRPRTARLFDFEYRFEIFVPEHRRRWGVYVLPFLMGERLVARTDLRAERSERKLLVAAAHLENGARAPVVAEALAHELRTLATWLGLEKVGVARRGPFDKRLRAALSSS